MIASEASVVKCMKVLLDRGAEDDFTNDVSTVLDEMLCRGQMRMMCVQNVWHLTLWGCVEVGGY